MWCSANVFYLLVHLKVGCSRTIIQGSRENGTKKLKLMWYGNFVITVLLFILCTVKGEGEEWETKERDRSVNKVIRCGKKKRVSKEGRNDGAPYTCTIQWYIELVPKLYLLIQVLKWMLSVFEQNKSFPLFSCQGCQGYGSKKGKKNTMRQIIG